MFKIYYQFHESPKDLTQLNNPISQSVKAWQIRFLGHCLQRLQEDLISEYALYHLTNGKPRPGGRKILSHEYAAKLINPENSPPAPSSRNWKSMEVDCWHHWEPHEGLSRVKHSKSKAIRGFTSQHKEMKARWHLPWSKNKTSVPCRTRFLIALSFSWIAFDNDTLFFSKISRDSSPKVDVVQFK